MKKLLNLTGNRLYSLPLVVLYLTDGCNSRCISCDIWRNPRRNMPMDLVESIAATCSELGIRWILLSGGEAMQHPNWAEIAQRFRQEGVQIMLLTNGLLLRKQAEQVIETVDELIVSLDGGTAKTYEAIRGVDAFDLILEGIDIIRAANIPVTTRTTIQQANFREIPKIIELGLTHDITNISFLALDIANPFAFGDRNLTQSSGALQSREIDELEDIIEYITVRFSDAFATGRIGETATKLQRILVQYFRSLLGEVDFPSPPCNAPHFSTVIEVDGQLRPCYFLPSYGRLSPQGDSLSKAINWNVAQDLRRAYRNQQRPECKRCVCPLYKSPRSLMRM
jgi:Fe-coproporphyrin III synthase